MLKWSTQQQGEKIWGRGSSDDKSGLIGILCAVSYSYSFYPILAHTAPNDNSSTVESLLEAKFKPRRTVVLAFGFDEESSGFQVSFSMHVQRPGWFFILKNQGGRSSWISVGKRLWEKQFRTDRGWRMWDGRSAVLKLHTKRESLVLAGFTEQFGSVIATPGIAEKGNLNVLVEVTAPGGHSSIPPPHTVFVILSCRRYILLIAVIPTEHWHPLRIASTLWAEPLPGQTCQSSQTSPSTNRTSLTHHIEKKRTCLHYASMHCRTCATCPIQSTPPDQELCLFEQSARIFAISRPWKQNAR